MSRKWARVALTGPNIGVSFLPKLACPACWPAYAGLLSSVGLGFLIKTAYLLSLTIGFLWSHWRPWHSRPVVDMAIVHYSWDCLRRSESSWASSYWNLARFCTAP